MSIIVLIILRILQIKTSIISISLLNICLINSIYQNGKEDKNHYKEKQTNCSRDTKTEWYHINSRPNFSVDYF